MQPASIKKILLITYYWPPAGGAGVQRWLKFVKYLSTMGFDIHVFTADKPEVPAQDESLLQEVPPQLKVLRSPIWEPFAAYRRFTGKKDKSANAFLSEESRGKRSWAEKLALWVRGNLFLPDAKRFWIRPSQRALAAYMQQHNISTVVSTGPPHSVHMIAYGLKKKLDIQWLADFRDPWTQIDYFHQLPMLPMVKRWHSRWEKKVVTAADKVVVVSPSMLTYFSALDSEKPHKFSLITNGYDSQPLAATHLDKAFTIVHSGSINADRTHPAFFKALQLALAQESSLQAHLQLVWIGKLSYEARQLLQTHELMPHAVFPGYIPYAQLAERLAKARILYLPINNTPDAKGIMTGKCFEYLAAQRPILAQGPVLGDLHQLLEDTQAGKLFPFHEVEALKDWILQRYYKFVMDEDSWQSKHIERYSRLHLSEQMAKLLHQL